jgi:tRNA(Ile)-lysidine synthase TilS/MesJ
MKEIEHTIIHKPNNQTTQKITIRPLLPYPKNQIQDYCDTHHVSYMTDESNLDPSVSMRNQIRQEIVMKLDPQQLQNRQDMYARLESSQTQYSDPSRDAEQ